MCMYIHMHITSECIYMLGGKTGQLRVMDEKQTNFSLHNLLCLLKFMLVYVNT